MCASTAEHCDRRREGFVSAKLAIWLVIGFAAYTGFKYFPAYLRHSQIRAAVQNVLDHGSPKLKDDIIRDKALYAAGSMSLPLEAEQIQIRREQREGERSIHVEFQVPIAISYLGSERELIRQVHAVKTYAVNEAEEARLAAKREDRAERRKERRQIHAASRDDYQQRVKEECAKSTRDLTVTHVQVTYSDGNYTLVGCDQAARW